MSMTVTIMFFNKNKKGLHGFATAYKCIIYTAATVHTIFRHFKIHFKIQRLRLTLFKLSDFNMHTNIWKLLRNFIHLRIIIFWHLHSASGFDCKQWYKRHYCWLTALNYNNNYNILLTRSILPDVFWNKVPILVPCPPGNIGAFSPLLFPFLW